MDLNPLYTSLKSTFPDILIEQNHPLAPYTTLRIGGSADLFINTKTPDQFLQVLKIVQSQASGAPITILGNGSNVLISDAGLRGVVIKNSSQNISIIDSLPKTIDFHHSYTQRAENEPGAYLDFTKLDYDESGLPQVLVKLSSGTPLPFAINSLIDQGITGLQWFAYIPGTIGGATWYNIHGGAYHFADYIETVEVFDLADGQTKQFKGTDLDWSYEHSFFQKHPELIILSTTLRLFRGDAALAKSVKDAWIAQKVKVQPMNSAGSVFANPSLEDCRPLWGEQKSSGWIIDHELGWKGRAVGDAQISLKHSNFIVNNGSATAADFRQLVKEIQDEVLYRFQLMLVPEVKFLGDFT